MDPASIGILVLRDGTHCVAANAALLARVARRKGRVGGSSELEEVSLELTSPESRDTAFLATVDKAQAGEASLLETDHAPLLGPRQGQWRLHFLPFVVDTEQGVAVLFEDITEQRITTEAFQSAEQRFRLLVDAAADGIVIYREHVVLYVNSEAVSLLGYHTPDELVGRTLGDLVDAEHRASFEGRLAELMSSRGTSTFETAFVRRGTGAFAVECRTSQARVDEDGTGFLFFRDIAERKRQQLRRDNARRVDSLARLSSAVGNELQGYAARMRRFVSRLRGTPEEQSAAIAGLMLLTDEVGERARQFGLTTPSNRHDNEATPLEALLGRVCSRLTEQVRDCVAMAATSGDNPRGEILVDLEPVEYPIRGDAAVIERGLVTLVMAAWHSTSLAQPLRISGTRTSKAAPGTQSTYVLSVSGGTPKGHGATVGSRAPTFPPTASPYESWEQGRDLELLAAFEALQSQGSRVEVQHHTTSAGVGFQIELALDPNRAATSISLPTTSGVSSTATQVDAHAGEAPEAAESAAYTERSGTQAEPSAERARLPILICDDEARLVSLTAGLLREFGFEVLTARTGAEALRVVSNKPVDVVVLDVNLPGEDASDIVAGIHAASPAKVILSSGYTEEDVEPSLLNAPIVKRFLSKPYTVDVLVRAIDAVRLEQAQSVSEGQPAT